MSKKEEGEKKKNQYASDEDLEGIRWKHNLKRWLINEGSTYFVLISWILANVIYFAYIVVYYQNASNFSGVRRILGPTLLVARASAGCINLNVIFLILTVCRNLISVLRTTRLNYFIPFDKNIAFHKLIAGTTVFFVILHSCCHFINFLRLSEAQKPKQVSPESLAYTSGPGWTGHIGLLILFIMVSSSLESMRNALFEIFWYSHHLFIIYLLVICFHGTFGFIHNNQGETISPMFWKMTIVPLTLYVLERIVREVRARRPTTLAKVILHPSKVIELQMKKPGFVCKSGQYIFINCPDVSPYQWHPFTMTNAPQEEIVSVHVRIVGDWTEDLATRLGIQNNENPNPQTSSDAKFIMPRILIDGPYGTASEDLFNYEVAICVGAGIGQTPFASLLKSIWYKVVDPNSNIKLKKVYFFGISRDTMAFEWFLDILQALEAEDLDHFLEIRQYLTGALKPNQIQNVALNHAGGKDPITGLKAPTNFGRPDFDSIFKEIKGKHKSSSIGVFYCGPVGISNTLHNCCNRYSSGKRNGTRFHYHKENF